MSKMFVWFFIFTGTGLSCLAQTGSSHQISAFVRDSKLPDSTAIEAFFTVHPNLKEYKKEVHAFYKKRNGVLVWHDKKGLTEFARVLFNEMTQIGDEGIPATLPYNEQFEKIFSENHKKQDEVADILMTALYCYYLDKVHSGLDPYKSGLTGWHIPREKRDYKADLEAILSEGNTIKPSLPKLFSQYYNLKKALKKYKEIETKGGWPMISSDKKRKVLKLNDTAAVIAGIRTRLFVEGYLKQDSGKNLFDGDLLEGISQYKSRQHKVTDSLITPELIKELNISVAERIKCIMVNMERCRWIPAAIDDAEEFIAVNIPSYRLHYFRDGIPFIISKVVVGKEATKTVVFSGEMQYVVFSPYWNVPNSILRNEIMPAIRKNPNYMAQHQMEWVGKNVRQRPGPDNPLGQVKFIFPNSNNIYLHDTSSKRLFNKNDRAFSHGCIRVEKARDLAIAIMQKDIGWSEKRVDDAMNAGKQSTYTLKQKIPVYIAYFTAWADANGDTAFYDDIYNRDARLAELLYKSI